jgi:hypothetical protein
VGLSFAEALLILGFLLAVAAGLSGWLHGTMLSISVLSLGAGIMLALLDVVEASPGSQTLLYLVELALILTLFADGLFVESELLQKH